uniref:Alpha-protein kinase vwkA n=1 Tax=Anthurium amnicola TaxID=1678845 RepID=A0A1D1XXZ1_9ARAE
MRKFLCLHKKKSKKAKSRDVVAPPPVSETTVPITTLNTTATLVSLTELEKQNLTKEYSKRFTVEGELKNDNENEENESEHTLVSSSPSVPDLEKLDLPEERLKRYVDEVQEEYLEKGQRIKAAALRENAISKTLSKIKRSMEVDFCFVLDCTDSMLGHIAAAKDCIMQVVNYVKMTNPCIKLSIGFVGYRDFCDGNKRLEVFNFTSSYESFKAKLAAVPATGGGDAAEDVLGGLNAAVTRMNWRQGTRILLHLGDYPPHGKEYNKHFHNAAENRNYDLHPKGDPNGLTAEGVLNEMQKENILYFFGKITDETDLMVQIFQKTIGEFPVFDLVGGDPIALVEKLYKAACSAITTSVTLTSSIGTDTTKTIYSLRQRKLEMNPNEPDWNMSESYSGVILWYRIPKTLNQLKDPEYFNKSNLFSRNYNFKISKDPFSAGAERYAYFGLQTDKEPHRKVVMKEYLSLGQTNPIEKYLEAVEVSTVAYYLSAKFNLATKRMDVKRVYFLDAELLRCTIDFKTQYYTVEPRLAGAEFKRFNVNSGVIVEHRPTLEAFAHFTYEHSKKYLVVYDLQGIELSDRFFLTDPAIHCVDPLRFGKTNLGHKGINDCFMANHKCNEVCKMLGLSK